MAIPEKLLKFKFHILFALSFSLILASIFYIAPSLIDVLAFFWPLLVSTALFLVAVVVFGRTSPPAAEVCGEKAGEGILDFVAGQSEVVPELEPESESEPEPEVEPESDEKVQQQQQQQQGEGRHESEET